MKNFVWASTIDFRPNPTRPREGRVLLGVAFGFEVRHARYLVLWARDRLEQAEYDGMDGVFRRLLAEPAKYTSRQFEKAIGGSALPQVVLQSFAEANRASFFVSPPVKVPESSGFSLTRLAFSKKTRFEGILKQIVAASIAGARAEELKDLRKFTTSEDALRTEIPDPWVITRSYENARWAPATL